MKTSTKFAAFVLAAVSPAAFAQQGTAQATTTSFGPNLVAYVYVSSYPTQNQTQINAYAAESRTPMPS